MKLKYFLLLLGYLLILCSCNRDENIGENANVSEAKPVMVISDGATEYNIDNGVSLISWIGSKPAGKHKGIIDIQDGFVAVLDHKIVGGKITIDLNTISSLDLREDSENYKKLINHLKSADFFDVANYPTAGFEFTNVAAYDSTEGIEVKEEYESEHKPEAANEYIITNPTHKVEGNLTMRGKVLNISFPARITFENGSLKAVAKFNIDRTLWNLKYRDEATVADKTKDKFIYNTVNVGFRFVGYSDEEGSIANNL
jgi:polyisoprenoid-binding protein YceI